jgi:hypothetical protein
MDCKYFDELVEGWKQEQYKEAVKQGEHRKEQLVCKHYNHKDNKPKVRMMPSMMVIRDKKEEEE